VRNRYRAKRALRGAAITVAASWFVLVASAYAMSLFKYTDNAVLGVRIVAILAILAIAVYCIVLPLRPKLRDEQVALYLEEHERSLKATVITAVEMQGTPAVAGGMPRSPAFIDRLTHAALERVHKTNDGPGHRRRRATDEWRCVRRGGSGVSAHDVRAANSPEWAQAHRRAVDSRRSAAPFSISVEPGTRPSQKVVTS
jgi:hypothetical protein